MGTDGKEGILVEPFWGDLKFSKENINISNYP